MRAWVLLVVLLAGCSQDGGRGPTQEPGSPPPPPELPREVDLQGCDGFSWVAQVPSDPVQEELPDGYAVSSPSNNPHLHVYSCEGVAVGNATHGPFSMAIAGTLLSAAAGQENPDGSDFYVFEMFMPCAQVPDLCAVLERDGWPVQDATVTVTGQDVLVAAAGGGVEYAGTAQVEDDRPTGVGPAPGGERYHHATDNVTAYWDQEGDQISGQVGAGTLECQGGTMSRITPCGTAPAPGTVQHSSFDGTVTFQVARPPTPPPGAA